MTSDERLFQNYQQGDVTAFEELFSRYQDRVFRLAFQKLKDESSALKALHRTFVRAHSLRARYSSRHTFAQWIFVIAKSEINRLSHGCSKVAFSEEVSSMSLLTPPSQEDFDRQLNTADLKLDAGREELLKMRYQDGLAFEEIADELALNAVSLFEKLKWRMKKWKRTLL